ncbi:MAG: hypothetical protein Kow0059_00140 [Candidatus Sumerlaeia bacterium]
MSYHSFRLALALFLTCNLSVFLAGVASADESTGKPDCLVVQPVADHPHVVELFDSESVLAVYADGSVLVGDTPEVREIIAQNALAVDWSLTRPERYDNPLGNEAEVQALARSSSQLMSLFEASKPSAVGLYAVQFQGPLADGWVEALEADGLTIVMPLPPYGYLVWGGDAAAKSAAARAEVRRTFSINAVRKLAPGLLDTLRLAERDHPDTAGQLLRDLQVLILNVEPGQAEAAHDALSALPGVQEHLFTPSAAGPYSIWSLTAPLEQIAPIANHPAVMYVEAVTEPQLTGEREMVINAGMFDASGDGPKPGASYERWLADKGVNGAGAVVQLVDTGLDRGNATNQPGTVHTDILGRVAGVVDYSGDGDGVDRHGHGTLNAGIIAGNPFTRIKDPGNYLVSMGVAPKARVFATKVANTTAFVFKEAHSTMVQEARSFGASISFQPWGGSVRSFDPMTGEHSLPPAYSSTAAEFDALTRVANGDNINPLSMLFVFSAGNEGWFCDMFECRLVDMTITDPAIAKNVISVGAFTGSPPEGGKRRDPVQSTSRGPTRDGRVAPTLVAPGLGISGMASQAPEYQNGSPVFYPEGQTLYTRGNGTSHAAAQVAGAAALFYDWWQRRHNYASTPSPAMMRAALIGATEDMQGGTYPVVIPNVLLGFGLPEYGTVDYAPDKNQGWGGLNLDKLIPDKGQEIQYIHFDQGDTTVFDANGQEWETTVYAVGQDTPLSIALAWTDPAASPNAGKALVNDLDLIVYTGADQEVRGNVLRDGQSVPGGDFDRANNVEIVKINNPYGAYRVKVKAVSLTGKIFSTDSKNRQDFALAIRGATAASRKGFVSFTAPYYRCDSTGGLILADLDLANTGQQSLTVTNVTRSKDLVVQLNETPPNSGVFRGTFDLSTTSQSGKLLAQDGDLLRVIYNDADNGDGQAAQVQSEAHMDCVVPQVTNFVVSDHTAFSVRLNFSFNKPVSGLLRWGPAPGNTPNVVSLDELSLHHSLDIAGLNPCTIYYAQVEITDAVGNINVDNNGGNYFAFQTLEDEPAFFSDIDANWNSTWFFTGAIQGDNDWTRVDDAANAYSPTRFYRTQGIASIKDIYLKTKNVPIPPYSRLTFYHKFSLEPGFDGGVAEISTDNGVHWRDLGQYITEGPYQGMIALFSGNPLMARLAWTNAWDNGQVEYRRSWIDLHAFRGKVAQIRFRLATDESIALPNSAWYIDDVKISYDSDCMDTLFIRLDKANYGPDETIAIRVLDPTLPSAASVTVKVQSDTESTPETVTCTKDAQKSNVYNGSIVVKNGGATGDDGQISCTDGDIITVTYKSSDNGGTSNPDQARGQAFYYLPRLLLAPPLNEGVTKFHNDVQNASVFPMELQALGADITVTGMRLALTADSQMDPARDLPANGIKLYEDTNDDRAFNAADDTLLSTVSYDPVNGAQFTGLNYVVTRNNTPRLFLLIDISPDTPFGTNFQFEFPDLSTDLTAKLSDNTPIIAQSSRPPRGLRGKIISRALLVDQNAPTIYLEDGETWQSAYHSISKAVVEARNRASRSKQPVEVWVARGRYMEWLRDETGTQIASNVHLYGGFGGTEANRNEPRRYIMETVIERPHFDETATYNQNWWSVVFLYGGGVLDGFRIYGNYNFNMNNYNDDPRRDDPRSTGVYVKIATDSSGGRLPVKIKNCVFHNLREFAIAAQEANACPNSVVSNCAFAWIRNQAVADIGYGSQFINCSFFNTGTWDIRGRNYFITNCAFDNTVAENSYWKDWWDLRGDSADYNRVRNCVLADGVYNDVSIYGDTRQNQNLSPAYVNPEFLDFRLQPGSPAINAGITQDNANPALVLEPLDLRGNDRIIDGLPDVGALEFMPNTPMYYVKAVTFGDPDAPQPVIFRPDQPVNIRMTLGSYFQPADIVTLGGRLRLVDRHFQVPRAIGLFEPVELGRLEQVSQLPFQLTLTGNPPCFYNLKMMVDFLKTDGSNEVVDSAYLSFSLPAFVDPVNGVDTFNATPQSNGGIRQPFKSLRAAMLYAYGHRWGEPIRIYAAEGTLKDYVDMDNSSWKLHFASRVEFYGGFNPRTWERDPHAFETVWTGENQRRIINNRYNYGILVDGFTIKEGAESAIEFYNSYGDWVFGQIEFTNNIFRNNNGANIFRLVQDYAQNHMTYYQFWSDVGAPLLNASPDNHSVVSGFKNTWALQLIETDQLKLTGDLTLEGWLFPRTFNRTTSAGWPYFSHEIFKITQSSNQFIYLRVGEDGRPFLQIAMPGWYETITADTQLSIGRWNHVAMTLRKDPAQPTKIEIYFYVDGQYAGAWTGERSPEFQISGPLSEMNSNCDGAMDELRIWTRALAPDEILNNRDREVSAGNGLLAAFHLNEGEGGFTYSHDGRFTLKNIHQYKNMKPTISIVNNTFEDNKAIGISAPYGVMPLLFHGNRYINNQNRLIEGLVRCPYLQISNNVFVGNSVPNEDPFIVFSEPHNHTIVNNTFVNNTCKGIAAQFTWQGDYWGVDNVVNNLFWNMSGALMADGTIGGRFVYNLVDPEDLANPLVQPGDWASNFSCTPLFDTDNFHQLAASCSRMSGPDVTLATAPPVRSGEGPSAPLIYIDDHDPQCTITGTYLEYSGYGSYKNNFFYITAAPATATWDLSGVAPGKYELKVLINDFWNLYDGDMPYTVTHQNGQDVVNVNQKANRNSWVTLGTFEFNGPGNQVQLTVDQLPGNAVVCDAILLIYRPDVPLVGQTEPPTAYIMSNLWRADEDIDGQTRPVGAAWDVGADQYYGPGDAQNGLVVARLVDGSPRLAGIPFQVDLQLTRNYSAIPAGFRFRVQYPAGAVTDLTAAVGGLGATPTVGPEQDAGGGLSFREVTAIPGNTANNARNPQLVVMTLTIADPYPGPLTIDVLPPVSGSPVVDATGADIPVGIDDSILANLNILAPNPEANFTALPTRGLVNPFAGLFLPVYFQDASLGYVTSWYWDFGDGTDSTERNPFHEYISPGIYTVTLTVEGPYGRSTRVRQDYIVASDVNNPPVANFTAEPFNVATQRVEGPAPLRVEFLDATNGPASSYFWQFGDGNTSTAQNPTHTYENQGDYTVAFSVDGPMGPDSITKTAYVHVTAPAPVQAAFQVDRPLGFAPHSVQFTSLASGPNIQFYYYDFGDGNWSQQPDTSHQYVLPGAYSAKLTVAGPSGFDVSDAQIIDVRQAFPERLIKMILLGQMTADPGLQEALDFNQNDKIDIGDLIIQINRMAP